MVAAPPGTQICQEGRRAKGLKTKRKGIEGEEIKEEKERKGK